MAIEAGNRDWRDALIRGVLDWPKHEADFERDGSLRDIYVLDTTADDWRAMVAMILAGNYAATLSHHDEAGSRPAVAEDVFVGPGQWHMTLRVGGVPLFCNFFTPDEIELSLDPKDVTAETLPALLAFLVDLGEATGKRAELTPENCPGLPIFRYDPAARELTWHDPALVPQGQNSAARSTARTFLCRAAVLAAPTIMFIGLYPVVPTWMAALVALLVFTSLFMPGACLGRPAAWPFSRPPSPR